MTQPLVSIAIPTFNQGPYIEDCLRSIQNQTYQNIEVLIQDALSGDETEKICVDFCGKDSRFKYFREKDLGQSDAINKSIAKSNGKYWTWICSDDFYCSSNAIAELVNRLEVTSTQSNQHQVVGVFGRAIYVSENGSYLGDYYTYTHDVGQKLFQRIWPFSQPSSLLKLDEVKRVGGVVKELNLGMDLDLFIKMTSESKFFDFVPQYVSAVRIQENSKSVKLRTRTAENALKLIRNHFGTVGSPWKSSFVREFAEAKTEEYVKTLRASRPGTVVRYLAGSKSVMIDTGNQMPEQFSLKKTLKAFLRSLIRSASYFYFTLAFKLKDLFAKA